MSEPVHARDRGEAAPRSYARLYALVIAALAADIAFLAWLTGRWR